MKLLDVVARVSEAGDWLGQELFQRAALCFEAVALKTDAAACWLAAGQEKRAAEYYLGLGDMVRAGALFLAQKEYERAMFCYRQWLLVAVATDIGAQVVARLGLAACLMVLGEVGLAEEEYRVARGILAGEKNLPPQVAVFCWEMVALYGVHTGRGDLVRLGFERALVEAQPLSKEEQSRLLTLYLEYTNEDRLLHQSLTHRLSDKG